MEGIRKDCISSGYRKWCFITCDGQPYLLASKMQREGQFLDMVFLPGHGHFEHTMLHTFMRLAWEPLVKHLAIDVLKYCSAYAEQTAYTVSDHHKGWQKLLIVLFGTGDSLLQKNILDTKNKSATHQCRIFQLAKFYTKPIFQIFFQNYIFLCSGNIFLPLWCAT